MLNAKDRAKRAAAEAAVELIQEGMAVGLGSGSTAEFFISRLGEKCRKGMKIQAVASSKRSQELAVASGIPVVDADLFSSLDITVDGADEVDSRKRLFKGGGGALFREKILAAMSHEMVVIVDEGKVVEHLGKFPLAVEISFFGHRYVLKALRSQGYDAALRLGNGSKAYVTENGNYIVDIRMAYPCLNPEEHELRLKGIPGVIETGIFLDLAGRVLVGSFDGEVRIIQ